MRVTVLIRNEPWYRRNVFIQGLKAAGHEIVAGVPGKLGKDDAILMWNRYADNHAIACRYEQAGGTVLVAENGYLGIGGTSPKFDVHPSGPMPHHYYTVMKSWHNGGAEWPVGTVNRFHYLQVQIKPWRKPNVGKYILVCPNRSFGVPCRMMPEGWAERVKVALEKEFSLPVKIRAHPGNNAPKVPLSADLVDAALVVIWSSSAGVHALCEGIPVICEAPYWICKPGTINLRQAIEDDEAALQSAVRCREEALFEMAYAQWTCEEIERGDPFRMLLP